MDDVGGNLEIIIKELMNEGQEPRVVYDNFDFRITPGQLTKDHQNTDNHWISQYVTFDRIDTSGMNNSHSIGDLTEFEIFGYLLQCGYSNRGHLKKTDQSQCRNRTMNSN